MPSHRRSLPLAGIALVATLLSGCSAVADAIPKGGPIAQSVAETYARMSSGVSVAPVEVVASRLSTYGAERPGGALRAPNAQVWSVTLSGAFPYGSCLIPLYPLGSSAGGRPCPPPAARERVLVDANSGLVIEVIAGG